LYKLIKPSHTTALFAAILATFLTACQAQDAAIQEKTTVATEIVVDDGPDLEFRGTISGDLLDFKDKLGDDTPAVKQFKKTGKNPYNGNEAVIKNGYTIYSTACSGCHGHLAEGKLGPALADSYWTYPGNKKDKGLFETIYGGGQGMMGPQRGKLPQDEILQVMSWVRSLQNKEAKPAAH
jgi:cytochrome c-L